MRTLYFMSDLHLGDDRLEIFFRDFYFKDVNEMNRTIIDNINEVVGEDDILTLVGDVCYTRDTVDLLNEIKCKNKVLVVGNYDEDKIDALTSKFTTIHEDYVYMQMEYKENDYFGIMIAHKPIDIYNAKYDAEFAERLELGICGHVHGLWKVQKYPVPMINVSVDLWNFKPVSMERIFDQYFAILNHYDENVFFEDKEIEEGG